MHDKGKITHEGVVESVENGHVRVRIIQTSACSSCQVKAMCASAEATEKVIDVWNAMGNHKVGDEVVVCGSLTMGRNAVWLAFGLPLVIMVLWIVAALNILGLGELASILGALGILAVYYALLACFKNRLSRHFSFWIE